MFQRMKNDFARDWGEASLRYTIIVWAIFVIILALTIRNKVALAAILAYEVLP